MNSYIMGFCGNPAGGKSWGRKSRGFTLIEVLVAMIVMAVGLLGLASMQSTGLRYSRNAYLQFQASRLIYDMGDRLRANKAEATAAGGVYDDLYAIPANPGCSSDDGDGKDCSQKEMAQYDAYRWLTDVAAILPGGQGMVTRTTMTSCTSSGSFNISVSWAATDFSNNTMTASQNFDICLDSV